MSRAIVHTLWCGLLFATACQASPEDTLAANYRAAGGPQWDKTSSVAIEYNVTGQGLSGHVQSRAALKDGLWSDNYKFGPLTGMQGFDGDHAWSVDQSGVVTRQDGGDQRALAVNEAYRRSNMWWRADHGGAATIDRDTRSVSGQRYDVLTVKPLGGSAFDAWFNADTHLLARIVEQQGPQTSTTVYSNYRKIGGMEIAATLHVSNGTAKYDQTFRLSSARFDLPTPRSAFEPPLQKIADFGFTHGDQTKIPFRLINNHIFGQVRVNGSGPYQFIFDTGGENVITPRVAKETGLRPEGRTQGGGAGSGSMDVAFTSVDRVSIGDAFLKKQIFAVAPIDRLSVVEGTDMLGMVGFETFHRFVTRIDYQAGTITLINPSSFDPRDSGTAIPFTFDEGNIIATAHYNGIKGSFIIDSGSRASITLNAPFVAKHKLNAAAAGIDAVTGWGIGGPTRSVVTRGHTFKIGDLLVESPIADYSTDRHGTMSDASVSGNIGNGILKRYVLTLDYAHRTLYLKPASSPVHDLDTYDRAGMWFNQAGPAFEIVDVTQDGPAWTAGLKPGDNIVSVDGVASASIALHTLRERLRNEPPGTRIVFAIRRGKKDFQVPVTLRELVTPGKPSGGHSG